jgi:hypothetical protein
VTAQKNWILDQAEKADPSYGSITLESPSLIDELDTTLKTDFWPPILEHLWTKDYPFDPIKEPRISSKSSQEFMRSLEFMIFEQTQRALARIKFYCGKSAWMISSEFFLGLPQETPFQVIHDLIANSRIAGNPPTLEVMRDSEASYYNIIFQNGFGESWGMKSQEKVIRMAKMAIDVNIKLYEQSIEGLRIENVSEFLNTAYEVYEAY